MTRVQAPSGVTNAGLMKLGGDTHGRVLTMRGDIASPCTCTSTTSRSWSWSVNAVSRIHLLSRSKPSTAADVDDADSLCLLLLIHSQYRHIIIPLDRCLPAYFNCPAHCRPQAQDSTCGHSRQITGLGVSTILGMGPFLTALWATKKQDAEES